MKPKGSWYKLAERIYLTHNEFVRLYSGAWSFRKTAERMKYSYSTIYTLYRAYKLCQTFPLLKEKSRKKIIEIVRNKEYKGV